MTESLTRVEINCTTGEEKVIELSAEEIAAMEETRIQAEAEQEALRLEAEAREALRLSARAKLIAGEPLTEEEAALLL
jgi:regulator of protease activity HflC (stomatin/prohibitin superfamily)